jgi:hypothetical protein
MTRSTYVFVLVGALLIPAVTLADERYFEFRPDYAQSLLVASAPQPVEQVFLPLNDHVSAIDFWFSNANTSGPVTLQLFSPGGSALGTATVTVPAIADGIPQRVKLSLPGQVATDATGTYVARISSTVPSMRVHYAMQTTVLAHNAIPQAAYTGGLARVGGEERAYAFLFALYEGSESTAPVITNVTSSVLSVQQVRIDFNASEPVDTTITYGPAGGNRSTIDYSGQYTTCPDGLAACSVLLPITDPGVEHSFTLTVRDVWGNTAQAQGTFTAAGVELSPTPGSTPTPEQNTPTPTPDTVPPTISNARVIDVDHESVSIAWTTNEAANSLLVIQFGIDRITAGGNSDSTLELEHLLSVANLGPETPYTARLQSADASGNDTSVDLTFSTMPQPTPGPSGTPIPTTTSTPTPTVSVGPSGDDGDTEASWAPPANGAPDGYRVDVIGPDGQLITTIRTFDTSIDLGDLPDGVTVIVYADRGDGTFEKVGVPGYVTTEDSSITRLMTVLPFVLGGLGLIALVGGLAWRRRSTTQAASAPPEPSAPSSPFTSDTHRSGNTQM